VPQPGQLYQIRPSSTLYIAVGAFNSRDLVSEGLKAEDTTYRVDFDKLATDHIHLVHRSDGALARVKMETDNGTTSSVSSPVMAPAAGPSPVPETKGSRL
jgi:hypothetical protein